jgi:hypothetical protein
MIKIDEQKDAFTNISSDTFLRLGISLLISDELYLNYPQLFAESFTFNKKEIIEKLTKHRRIFVLQISLVARPIN